MAMENARSHCTSETSHNAGNRKTILKCASMSSFIFLIRTEIFEHKILILEIPLFKVCDKNIRKIYF